ncbi:MAG: hypothetical protein IT323_13445 [Anaerolineae bacterium]|nr:hypothetical protein [Anaerolineae bacterium]
MTPQEVTTLIGSFGFPIALILFLLIFTQRTVWPYVVKRVEFLDQERAERHNRYIAQVEASRVAQETNTKVLMLLQEKLEQHESGVDRRLEDVKVEIKSYIDVKYDALVREVQSLREGREVREGRSR